MKKNTIFAENREPLILLKQTIWGRDDWLGSILTIFTPNPICICLIFVLPYLLQRIHDMIFVEETKLVWASLHVPAFIIKRKVRVRIRCYLNTPGFSKCRMPMFGLGDFSRRAVIINPDSFLDNNSFFSGFSLHLSDFLGGTVCGKVWVL